MLSDTQVERYSRQIILPQVGGRGQLALLSATVAIRGSNEMATTAALYLAAAGVGRLCVSPATLAAIEAVNPDCQLVLEDGGEPTAMDAVRPAAVLCAGAGPDICVRVNAACVAMHVPMIVGEAADALGAFGALGTLGWMSICAGHEPGTPCYRCLSPRFESVRRSDTVLALAPPLGTVTAGFIGTLMATEAMKIMLRLRVAYAGRLVTFDALAGEIHEEPVAKDPQCAVCGGLA